MKFFYIFIMENFFVRKNKLWVFWLWCILLDRNNMCILILFEWNIMKNYFWWKKLWMMLVDNLRIICCFNIYVNLFKGIFENLFSEWNECNEFYLFFFYVWVCFIYWFFNRMVFSYRMIFWLVFRWEINGC